MRKLPEEFFMKRTLLSLLMFTSAFTFAQTNIGTLRLVIVERTKESKGRSEGRPVPNETLTIVLNDSINFIATTDSNGYINIENLQIGKYKVKTTKADCETLEITNIPISQARTSILTVQLICTSYINSLTEKEKRQFGYK